MGRSIICIRNNVCKGGQTPLTQIINVIIRKEHNAGQNFLFLVVLILRDYNMERVEQGIVGCSEAWVVK